MSQYRFDDVRRAVDDAKALAADPEKLDELLDALTALHVEARAIADFIAEIAPGAVAGALLAGISQERVLNRPYNYTTVLQIAREIGMPRKKPGPRKAKKLLRPLHQAQ